MMFRIGMILAAAALLVGCGDKGDEDAAGVAPAQHVPLEFWHIQTYEPTGPAVDAAVRRFEDDHHGMWDVKVQAIKNDPFKTKLATAMATGTPPDVFHTWGGGILASYVENGTVLDLTDRVSGIERFHPAALDICKVKGRVYALPVDVTVVPMWYNQAVFAKHGLTPPTTLAEFAAVCDKLTAAGVTPLALGNAKSWPGAFYFVYLATRYGGPEAIAAGRFEDPAFIRAGEELRKMVAAGYFNKGFNGVDYDEARRMFFNEEAAMILMGTWILAHASQEAPEFLREKMGCFPFPGTGQKSALDTVVVGGVNAGYAAAAAGKQPAGAARLIEYLADDHAMRDWAATGRIPALTREAAKPLLSPTSAVAAEILFGATALQLYYDQLLPPALATMHKETTQGLFAGTMTPAQAAKAMAETAAREQ